MFDSLKELQTRRAASMVIGAVVVLAASACGGGGSGGVRESNDPGIPTQPPSDSPLGTQQSAPQPEPTLTPANFETLEYDRGRFLRRINAADAYASDGTEPVSGAGVVVAVIDTGVDVTHPEFSGRIASGGRMFLSPGDPTDIRDLDPGGHGTHVAGIIGAAKDEVGMHGVAWGASILPISYGEGLVTDGDLADMFAHAQSMGARVFNNSWSMNHDIDSFASKGALEAFMPRTTAALRSIAAEHGVVVFAAGNGGNPQPQFWGRVPELLDELRGIWMTAVAVNGSGSLASYSSACGDTLTAAWCLAAPGGSAGARIVSTLPGGGYGERTGTSMAAPMVAGSVAVLLEKFPTLNGRQVVERIFHTADKTGIYADTALYGQGLLDLGAAASPVGGLFMPLSTSIGGEISPLGTLTFTASTTEAEKLRAALAGESLLAVDGFQRAPFRLEAAQFVVPRTAPAESLAHKLARRSARAEVSDPGRTLTGYRRLAGGETVVSADLAGSAQVAIAADAPFGALMQAFSPLRLTSEAALDLLVDRGGPTGRTVGLGLSQRMGQDWRASVSAYTGEALGGEQALGAQLVRRLGNASLALSVSRYGRQATNGHRSGDSGIAAANVRDQTGRTSITSLMTWLPSPQWELFSQVALEAERSDSHAGSNFALNRDIQRTRITLGSSHRLADSRVTVSGLYRVTKPSRTSLAITLPNWVQTDGTVTRKTMSLSYDEPIAHTLGLHFTGALDRRHRTRLTAGVTHDTYRGSEATATLLRQF